MIIKTPDYQTAIDTINKIFECGRVPVALKRQLKREVAGFVAEHQVAYQLTSYFQNSDEIFVFNNLAIQHGDAKIQIDHLVFSKRAFYLIESKSIAGTIGVNENGEFHRQYGRRKDSTKSPIEQVKRQETVLIDLLKANKEKLLGKILGLQKGFTNWTPKHFVAISEKGTIKRSEQEQFQELMKFDQIASAIMTHHKNTDVGFLKSIGDESGESFNLLNKKEIERIISFLKSSDISQEPIEKIRELISKSEFGDDIILSEHLATQGALKVEKEANLSLENFSCAKCNSLNLRIMFGKSYYFKCNDCDGNTPIKLICKKCSGPMRTRKQKDEFYKVCKQCGIDELYFVNKTEQLNT